MTKPPIRNKPKVHINTPPRPCSPPSETSLVNLSWLPTALYSSPDHPELPDSLEEPAITPEPEIPEPELSPELSTPLVYTTPVQDSWNILDEIGATEEISFDLQAC